VYKKQCILGILAVAAVCSAGQTRQPVFGQRTYNNANYAYVHADLNNDGREDLVFATLHGFGVVLSTGDATYGAETDYTVPDSFPAGVVTMDINNDGKLDIFAFNSGAPGFYEYLNNGDGTFHLQATYVMSQVVDMAVGDFNHDGYPDLAFTTGGGSNTLHVWFNNHASGFNVGPSMTVPANGIQNLTTGDFDGDGKADLFAGNNNGNYIYFGDNTGHFTVVNATTAHVPQVMPMDIDGDGKTDLVGAAVVPGTTYPQPNQYYRQLFVIYGNAARTIAETSIPLEWYTQPALTGYPTHLATVDVGDFNGDGHQDIALEEAQNSDGSGARRLVLLTGKGNREWNPEQVIYSDSTLSFGVATIRANRDNLPDLLTSTYNGANVAQFFVNDTVGGFYGGCALPDRATGFNLCTPTTSTSNTVTFKMSAAGQTTARKIEVWVDGVKEYEQIASYDFSHYAFLQKALTLSTGTHHVTFYEAGYDNLLERADYTFTVQ